MNKKPYIAPIATIVLPELEGIMLRVDEGSAIEVLTNDFHLHFEEDDNPGNSGSSCEKENYKLWDSF